MKKKIEPICNNCICYDRIKKHCKVAVLIEGKQYHMPVEPQDHCVMDELGIEVNQVRWWVEDADGKPTSGNGKVLIEYPEDFFGKEKKK